MTDNDLLKMAVCGVLFPYYHVAELTVGPSSRAQWNPEIFRAIGELVDEKVLRKLGDFHWGGTRLAVQMANAFHDLSESERKRGFDMMKPAKEQNQ